MRVLSREMTVPCRDGRPVFPGFVTYVSVAEPILLHRYGRVDASDTYDDFDDYLSRDNGRTWSQPIHGLRSRTTPAGRVRYAENAAFFDPDTGRLLTFCSRGLYPHDKIDVDEKYEVVTDMWDPAADRWRGEELLAHALPGGLCISFCFPLKTCSGKLLLPAMTLLLDGAGNPVHYQGCWAPSYASLTVQGRYQADGSLAWQVGRPVDTDPARSSRGFDENTLAELADGRVVMVMRGDNGMFPERPGHKWHCFSDDEGLTWSRPEPLGCSDGGTVESGSNGSALLRSARNGKLYWIGNLALDGERANANWPRSPLCIVEMQEEPLAFRRDTITVIDRRAPDEPPLTQLSNFRFYQDRLTGDVVIYLARFGERDPDNWMDADYYRYRVALE
ncbi:MAG: exo-alpha-sialidase [Armatimonadetes bacterium]|nr:exo-alpha-sialidase [Armatimonadota bacterium]